MGRHISLYRFDRTCQWSYILKPPYNLSQTCTLIRPKLLNNQEGKQNLNKKDINCMQTQRKKTRILESKFRGEIYNTWLNQIKSVFFFISFPHSSLKYSFVSDFVLSTRTMLGNRRYIDSAIMEFRTWQMRK